MNTGKADSAASVSSNLVRMNGQPFSETSSYTTAPVPERIWRKRNRWRKRHGRIAKLTRHHNLSKSRNGSNNIGNIIWLTDEHHKLLHKLFGNRTLKEIIAVLERLEQKRVNKTRLRRAA